MGQPKAGGRFAPPPPPPRTDVRFPYVDELPANVPALQTPPTSMFPFQTFGPGEATYYFPIKFDGCNPTGVFFPNKFAFGPTIDVILFFHGFKQGEFQKVKTIDYYWGGNFHDIRLRENINDSGKSVVLIAPTMGEKPGSMNTSDMGIFSRQGGGDAFLAEVLRWIADWVPQYKTNGITPTIRNLVLAGHSGAGVILDVQSRSMRSKICEVWGFDSLYSQDKFFHRDVVYDWWVSANVNPGTKFFFHWGGGNPKDNALALDEMARKKKLTMFSIKGFTQEHYAVMTQNFSIRLKEASCLS